MQHPNLVVTFLGTGTSSGVPMIACGCEVCTSTNPKDARLRSSIMVQSQHTTLVVDTTPDFRQQMLTHAVTNVDAILFTHPHKDHIAGLDDVKAFNYFNKKAIDVYANTFTEEALRREFQYIFAEQKYPGIPDITLHEIANEPFLIGDIWVTPIMVWHLHMPVLGFRFGAFTYITDANDIPAPEQAKIVGTSVLVLNALRHTPHISHFTLQQAIDMAKQLQIPTAYFTHISHQLGMHQSVSNGLPPGCNLAYDGLVVQI